MTTEWKLVPVEPNEEMRSAECRGDEVALPSIEDMDLVIAGCRVEIPDDISREHFRPFMRGANASLDAMAKYRLEKTLDAAAAPVPPAGGEVEAQMLEEMYRRFGAGKQADDWLCVDDTQLGVEFCADFMRPHVTRLTAERDALKAEVERLNDPSKTKCLTCNGRKTVPPKEGQKFWSDCPECCGEEG